MKILLDMNIPIQWEETLNAAGHEARHWRDVGKIDAPDTELMTWADQHGFVVFTHDLDFGALLFATNAQSPSVIQLRAANILPDAMGELILQTLKDIESELEQGALVIIDPKKKRLRMLPLK